MKFRYLAIITLMALLPLLLSVDTQGQSKSKRSISPKTSKTSASIGALAVEAGLVFKSGDAKPVARTQFYLLQDSLDYVLEGVGFKPLKPSTPLIESFAASIYGMRKYGIMDDDVMRAENAIKRNSVSDMTTDFNGKGSFSGVKTGSYYLIGISKLNQVVIWNMPVQIKSVKQSIILDQDNAAQVF